MSGDQRRIWIVDDSPLDAQRARQALASDYDVELFHDGSAALERLASHTPPHVMVLDWVMPGITGVEVCRFLRADPERYQRLAILLLTVQRNTEQIVEGLSAGANDYLAKPFEAEELRARVRTQIRTLELLERAQTAEQRRLDFYSIIAHDLRTPLNSISLRTQLILSGHRGPISAPLGEDMVKIDAHIRSLVTMINDFLEMARSDAAPLTIERAEVDVVKLIDATMEALRPQLEQGGLEWQRGALEAGEVATVMGDARRLSQVFANLLGNSIKFTPAGGVITTRVARKEAWLEVSVEDTGLGVPREAMRTLFDRFTRAAGSAASIPGSGLGLMIVKQIVEAHGGSVGVDESRDRGSRFWVRLPRP